MQSVLSVIQSPLVNISVSDSSSMIVVNVILRNGISSENIEGLFSDRNKFQSIRAFYETSLSEKIAMGTRGGRCGPSWG